MSSYEFERRTWDGDVLAFSLRSPAHAKRGLLKNSTRRSPLVRFMLALTFAAKPSTNATPFGWKQTDEAAALFPWHVFPR